MDSDSLHDLPLLPPSSPTIDFYEACDRLFPRPKTFLEGKLLVNISEFSEKIIEVILFMLIDLPIKARRYAGRVKKPVSFRVGLCTDICNAIKSKCDNMICLPCLSDLNGNKIVTDVQEYIRRICNATCDDEFDKYILDICHPLRTAEYTSLIDLMSGLETYRQFVTKLDIII